MEDPLKKYRRRFRVWQNDRRLQQETEEYQRQFSDRRLCIPDETAIGNTIHHRYPGLKPKQKGQLRILAVYHHYNWENTAIKPALERFGDVWHYDWMTSFRKDLDHWHRSMRQEMNNDLVQRVRALTQEQAIDVIFAYLSGEQVTPDTMEKLSDLHIPMINLSLNDKENFVGKIRGGQALGIRDICRFFSICWTSTEDALPKYCVEGARPLYLPEAANPDIHKASDIERTIDVSFVGQQYGNRQEIIDFICAAGIDVQAYGFGWPNGPLDTEAMVELYSKSRINLGFGGVIGHTGAYCLKGRDFEVPMSGGLYLTEYHPELERVYDIGREIVTYRDAGELLEKIRDLLAHPEKADSIRRMGFERALRDHSWEMRFEKIFRLLGLIV